MGYSAHHNAFLIVAKMAACWLASSVVFLESFLETQPQACSFTPSKDFINTQYPVSILFLPKIQ